MIFLKVKFLENMTIFLDMSKIYKNNDIKFYDRNIEKVQFISDPSKSQSP